SSRRQHTKSKRDWSSDVCSSDLWKGLVNSNNEPFYTSKEEWEAECREEIEAIKDEIASDREILSECWSEYSGKKKDYQSGTFDEEMKKVLEWRQGYSKLLGNEV